MQRLTGATETKKRIVESAMEYYRRSFPPYIPQDVVEDLEKSLQSADIESHAAQIYPKYISTEDAVTFSVVMSFSAVYFSGPKGSVNSDSGACRRAAAA